MRGTLRDLLIWLAIVLVLWIGCELTAGAAPATVAEHAAYAVDITGQGGSGIGIHDQLIATNAHVVVRMGTWCTCTNQWQSLRGEVVACDPVTDVALVYVSSSDVRWLKIAATPPQVGDQAWFLGFGTWRSLRPRVGKILSQTKYQVADGVYTWKLSTPAHSGDSGCGAINQRAEVVALIWGTDEEAAAMLPASLVSASVQSWATKYMGPRAVEFAGCWGNQCPSGQCPSSGGRPVYPARPSQQPTTQQPVPQPIVTAPPVPAPPVEQPKPQVCIPLEQLVELLTKDPRFRARDGKDGAAGKDGLPGKDGQVGKDGPPGPAGAPGAAAVVDYDQLASEVIKRLPPLQVEAYDSSGALVDSQSYPFPGPIRLRYGQAK